MESLQNLFYEKELGDYQKNLDENGIFHCSDIGETHLNVCATLEPQGIRFMFRRAILDKGESVSYVGFDECRENRAWSPKQIRDFKLTADAFPILTIRLRLKQESEK